MRRRGLLPPLYTAALVASDSHPRLDYGETDALSIPTLTNLGSRKSPRRIMERTFVSGKTEAFLLRIRMFDGALFR